MNTVGDCPAFGFYVADPRTGRRPCVGWPTERILLLDGKPTRGTSGRAPNFAFRQAVRVNSVHTKSANTVIKSKNGPNTRTGAREARARWIRIGYLMCKYIDKVESTQTPRV